MMILGLVRWMQPVHGYDVRRELLSWSADKWANVQPGSIYHALRKLTDEGLLRTVSVEQVGARPARTTYEVTPKGDEEFETLLRAQWWQLNEPSDPFVAAFSFLPAMPRDEAAAALRNRANLIRAGVESMRASLDSDWVRTRKPVHVGWMFELWLARAEADMAWCERIAERIESGVSYLPAGLEQAEGWSGWTHGAAPDAE
ncbi:PadR family transcriptional regulator [Micromonospora halotolerans]|uniref:PadR family transcriptional regulator n=1 Tax=Micromonospora halotolerans TaxID=709879 RepID=A0ABZ0A683_9ACTN|nr:PadR family transcriptional regulator [Micromonospora halotolerans]WNM42918.1 PadR family transcriptional regulator [Micromonospora halotolerans]